MWELDSKESRTPKNWCIQTVVLENTLAGPLESKEIKPVNLRGNQPWNTKVYQKDRYWNWSANTLVIWCKQLTHWKRPWCRKDWRKKEMGQQMMRCLDSITNSMYMNLGKFQEMVRDREAWSALVCGVTKSWSWVGNWTITSYLPIWETQWVSWLTLSIVS